MATDEDRAADASETACDGDQPLPGVPETSDDGDAGVPPVSGSAPGQARQPDPEAKPIKFRRRPVGDASGAPRDGKPEPSDAADGCGSSCGCSDGATEAVSDGVRDSSESRARQTVSDSVRDSAESRAHQTVSDGGTRPKNVDADGNLRDLKFTDPSEGKSQDVYDDRPDERVQMPEGVDLDTPGYSIRGEMNDIEEPDDKTWFMELDTAVIDEGRCIQCGTCVAACPSDSIGIGDDGLPELVKMCTGCSLCWDFCPRGGLRYERQWKITGGEDNVTGAGDPITEFSAKVEDDWRENAGSAEPPRARAHEVHENAQDGGLVTSVLIHLLEAGEIDGALIATESEDEAWKAESFLATTPEELIENAGSFYNQTMALGNLGIEQWEEKLPDEDPADLSLALVGTPCEIEGIRALQDFDWDYAAQEDGVRAIDYTIALMCTKNFNYRKLMGEKLEEERGIDLDNVGKMDVLDGKMMVYDDDGEMIVEEDVENFHDAALKGCDECADFTGYAADLTVGSVGSSDEYSSVIVRTEAGLDAWNLTEPDLDYHDLEDRSAVGGLQSWDKKKAFESLQRPFDPDAPRFIDYADHAENYGTELHAHETDH